MAHKKRVHEKTIDAIPPKHACGLCGYRTNSKFSLSRHKEKCNRSLNQNPIDHICNICSKKFSTKKILTKHGKLHNKSICDTPISAASCVVCKKSLWTNGIWRDTQRKTMDSPRKEMLLRTVQGLQYSLPKRLWKRKWVKREQRGFFTNVKSVSTVLSKKHILGDTFKISMTEGQNQKCEEGKLRLVLSLTEPSAGETQKVETNSQREMSRSL